MSSVTEHQRPLFLNLSSPTADALAKPQIPDPIDPQLQRALHWVARGDYTRAYESLPHESRALEVRNARAACLMRLGRFQEAVNLLRDLVLATGCTWSRPDVPLYVKVNYATALFFAGHTSGAADLIAECNSQNPDAIAPLESLIDQWVKEMTWWQRLNWTVYRTCSKPLPSPPSELTLGWFGGNVAS